MMTSDQFKVKQEAEAAAFARQRAVFDSLPEEPKHVRDCYPKMVRAVYEIGTLAEALMVVDRFERLPYVLIRSSTTSICLAADEEKSGSRGNDALRYEMADGCPVLEIDCSETRYSSNLRFFTEIMVDQGVTERISVEVRIGEVLMRPEKVPQYGDRGRVIGYSTRYPVDIHEDQVINWYTGDTRTSTRTTFLWTYDSGFEASIAELQQYMRKRVVN